MTGKEGTKRLHYESEKLSEWENAWNIQFYMGQYEVSRTSTHLERLMVCWLSVQDDLNTGVRMDCYTKVYKVLE